MSTEPMMFKERTAASEPAVPTTTAGATPPAPSAMTAAANAGSVRCRVVDLDMGEGSREEGFRLNGCR